MMEGTYFFGEHLRWNLGWHNPNPAGAFVAMWIPWLWGLAAKAHRAEGRWRATLPVVFLLEAGLWFLLCKTYSRGALVAVAAAGALFILITWLRGGRSQRWNAVFARLAMVAVLLVATGFFDRITPGYVVHDASAGNRLTLWRGGLQMIAVSPWTGWGVGQSGPAFMHWFQPLEANEAYAGMVNSYLHLAVERGLPMFACVMVVALFLLAFGSATVLRCSSTCLSSVRRGVLDLQVAALCSLAAFLVANFFSTLWIFNGLLWAAGAGALVILVLGVRLARAGLWRHVTLSLIGGLGSSCLITASVLAAGHVLSTDLSIKRAQDGTILCQAGRGLKDQCLEFFPDETTFGTCWGKEVRRLAAFRPDLMIRVPERTPVDRSEPENASVEWIIACGLRVNEGCRSLEKNPGAALVLINLKSAFETTDYADCADFQ